MRDANAIISVAAGFVGVMGDVNVISVTSGHVVTMRNILNQQVPENAGIRDTGLQNFAETDGLINIIVKSREQVPHKQRHSAYCAVCRRPYISSWRSSSRYKPWARHDIKNYATVVRVADSDVSWRHLGSISCPPWSRGSRRWRSWL